MSLCSLGIRDWPCRQSYSRQNLEIFLCSLLEGQRARSRCSFIVCWVNKYSPPSLLGLSQHRIGSCWSERQGAEGAPTSICAQVKRCELTCTGVQLRAKCCDAFLEISITSTGRPPSLSVSEYPLESIRNVPGPFPEAGAKLGLTGSWWNQSLLLPQGRTSWRPAGWGQEHLPAGNRATSPRRGDLYHAELRRVLSVPGQADKARAHGPPSSDRSDNGRMSRGPAPDFQGAAEGNMGQERENFRSRGWQ